MDLSVHIDLQSSINAIHGFQESKPDANQWLSAVSPGKSKTVNEDEEDSEDDLVLVYECERDQVNLSFTDHLHYVTSY